MIKFFYILSSITFLMAIVSVIKLISMLIKQEYTKAFLEFFAIVFLSLLTLIGLYFIKKKEK